MCQLCRMIRGILDVALLYKRPHPFSSCSTRSSLVSSHNISFVIFTFLLELFGGGYIPKRISIHPSNPPTFQLSSQLILRFFELCTLQLFLFILDKGGANASSAQTGKKKKNRKTKRMQKASIGITCVLAAGCYLFLQPS